MIRAAALLARLIEPAVSKKSSDSCIVHRANGSCGRAMQYGALERELAVVIGVWRIMKRCSLPQSCSLRAAHRTRPPLLRCGWLVPETIRFDLDTRSRQLVAVGLSLMFET